MDIRKSKIGSTPPPALGDRFVTDTAPPPAWFRPSIGNLSTSCLRVALIMGFIGRYRSILRDRVNLYPSRSGTGWLLDPTDTTVGVHGVGIYHARSRSTGHLSTAIRPPAKLQSLAIDENDWLRHETEIVALPIRSPRFGIVGNRDANSTMKNWDGNLLKKYFETRVFFFISKYPNASVL